MEFLLNRTGKYRKNADRTSTWEKASRNDAQPKITTEDSMAVIGHMNRIAERIVF